MHILRLISCALHFVKTLRELGEVTIIYWRVSRISITFAINCVCSE